MARTRVNGNIKVGRIYECDFGRFKHVGGSGTTTRRSEACEEDYNYRIPNEIIKKRAVVVIGKHRGLYLVVPISSTEETDKKPHKYPEGHFCPSPEMV